MCLCTGYFEPEPGELSSGAEHQLRPTAAINRTFVEDPYYQYPYFPDNSVRLGMQFAPIL